MAEFATRWNVYFHNEQPQVQPSACAYVHRCIYVVSSSFTRCFSRSELFIECCFCFYLLFRSSHQQFPTASTLHFIVSLRGEVPPAGMNGILVCTSPNVDCVILKVPMFSFAFESLQETHRHLETSSICLPVSPCRLLLSMPTICLWQVGQRDFIFRNTSSTF